MFASLYPVPIECMMMGVPTLVHPTCCVHSIWPTYYFSSLTLPPTSLQLLLQPCPLLPLPWPHPCFTFPLPFTSPFVIIFFNVLSTLPSLYKIPNLVDKEGNLADYGSYMCTSPSREIWLFPLWSSTSSTMNIGFLPQLLDVNTFKVKIGFLAQLLDANTFVELLSHSLFHLLLWSSMKHALLVNESHYFMSIVHSKLIDDCNICGCSSMNIVQLKWFVAFLCIFSPNTSSLQYMAYVNVHHWLCLPLNISDPCLISSITCFSTQDDYNDHHLLCTMNTFILKHLNKTLFSSYTPLPSFSL